MTRRAWPLLWTLALVSGCGTVLRTAEYLEARQRLSRIDAERSAHERGAAQGWHAAVYNLAWQCARERAERGER